MNQELITLEQKLSILTINSEESFILIDIHYQIIAFNRQFKHQYLKYFGTKVEKGESIFKLIKDDRADKLKKVYDRVFAGSIETTEIEIPTEEGHSLIFLNKFKPAFDEKGKIMGAFVTSTDVTQLKQFEIDREAHREQLEFETNNIKALINNTQDQIWSFNVSEELLTLNEAYRHQAFVQVGIRPDRGMNVFNFIESDELKNSFRENIQKVLKGESFTVKEQGHLNSEQWFEISFNPIKSGKDILGVACIKRDITESMQFQKELIINQNRLKRAQAIALIGHWEYDSISKKLKLSEEVCNIYGIKLEEFDQTVETWISYNHPEDAENIKVISEKLKLDPEDQNFYFRIIRADGEVRYLYSEFIFKKNSKGEVHMVYGILQDITKRKNNEIQLQKLLKESNRQNNILNNFSQIVSHNIRTNSQNIQGLTEMLKEAEDSTEQEALIEMLSLSSNKLNQTVDNLCDFLMFQNSKQDKYKAVYLREEIEKSCSVINNSIKQNQVEIINNVGADVQITIIHSYLDSILVNLISNAIKYSSEERHCKIEFNIEKESDYTILELKDNGIGIDLAENGEKVFGLFNTFHGNKDAIGFGLYMVKNQIESMNGKIEIESQINVGTSFKIYFNEQTR